MHLRSFPIMLSLLVLLGSVTAADSQEAKPAAAGADARLDAEGFPKWPLFDDRAAADTLQAINVILPADVGKPEPKPKRPPKKPAEPMPEERARLKPFEFAPMYTHGEFSNLPKGAYMGAVVAPNKKIYFIPFNAATVLVYDTEKKTTESINLPNGDVAEKYVGGVLGANGCIYCTPHQAERMAVIDTKTHDVKLVPGRPGGWKWRGGVVAAGGKIYWPPDRAGLACTVNTADGDKTGEVPKNPPFPPSCFSGATIGGDGRIYFAPQNSLTCFRIDPWRKDKVESFGNAPGGFAYYSAVTGPDGRVYCVPANADHVLVIDPAAQPLAKPLQFPGDKPVSGNWKFVGGVLGPDGNIYCIPSWDSRILVIDTPKKGKPEANLRYWGREQNGVVTEEYRQDRYVQSAYAGGVLGPDGRIYFVPFNAKHLLAIGKEQRMNMNWVLSPMFNKF